MNQLKIGASVFSVERDPSDGTLTYERKVGSFAAKVIARRANHFVVSGDFAPMELERIIAHWRVNAHA